MVERFSLCYSSFLPAFLAGSAWADFSSPRPPALPWITLCRRSPPAPPLSGRPPFLSRRYHTGRDPPAPAQTSGSRAPPAGAPAPQTPVLHHFAPLCTRYCKWTAGLTGLDRRFQPVMAVSKIVCTISVFTHRQKDSLTPEPVPLTMWVFWCK